MKNIVSFLMISALVFFWGVFVHAEEAAGHGSPSMLTFEIENQTPCFFFGGYQLSVGMRSDRFRYRISVQNSGNADFESNGIDRRNGKFRRDYDDGSYSISVDYFLNNCFFTYVCLGSNRWLLQNNDTSATNHLRTFDAGLGAGAQYFVYKNIFMQLSAHVNFRASKSLTIENEEYTIPGIDWSPGLRLGYQF